MATPVDPTGSAVRVEQLGPGDWARWRALRLRALEDAPAAFGSTHAREVAFAEDDWRRRLAGGCRVVAAVDDSDVGLAGVHLADGPDRPQLFGMWVDPAWRGREVGERMAVALTAWARSVGQSRLRLWVMADNQRARDLYLRVGFVDEPDPATPAPDGCEQAMVVVLGPA